MGCKSRADPFLLQGAAESARLTSLDGPGGEARRLGVTLQSYPIRFSSIDLPMSELRQDPVSGRWVIMAPDRALRPNASRTWPGFDATADDPFAEGRESDTPGELLSYRKPGTVPDAPGWRVRVIPNKYPAVSLEEEPDSSAIPGDGPGLRVPAAGPHEVIVECPQFATCLSQLSPDHVTDVVRAYRDRLRFHRDQQTCAHALVFKNRGIAGGATLAHTHSQLIGTPWIPTLLAAELTRSRQYFEQHGRSIFEELISGELSRGERIVAASESLVTLCPYASRVPLETWIVPTGAVSRFEDLDDDDLPPVAKALRMTLLRLNELLPEVPYNFYIHSSPFTVQADDWYRWHIEIIPRAGNTAGFEWGGGDNINSLLPEDAARTLRQS
jgi:UDPglucose--hexose-1-phosphate uridylyltransferase